MRIKHVQHEFETMTNNKKLPYLLGKIQQRANTAARFVNCCDKRLANGTVITVYTVPPPLNCTYCPPTKLYILYVVAGTPPKDLSQATVV